MLIRPVLTPTLRKKKNCHKKSTEVFSNPPLPCRIRAVLQHGQHGQRLECKCKKQDQTRCCLPTQLPFGESKKRRALSHFFFSLKNRLFSPHFCFRSESENRSNRAERFLASAHHFRCHISKKSRRQKVSRSRGNGLATNQKSCTLFLFLI